MKITALIISLLGFTTFLEAQQLPIYSQYFWNDYVVNPASTASRKNSAIQMTYRNQWGGFSGSPNTYSIGGYSFLHKIKLGYGGIVFQDENGGGFSQTGAIINSNYLLRLNTISELFVGVGGIFNQYAFNGTQITMAQDDPQLNYSRKHVSADLNFGLLYSYNKTARIGFSANQLLGSKLSSFDTIKGKSNQANLLKRQYNLTFSYMITLKNKNRIEPYVLIRSILVTRPQIQIGGRFINDDNFYAGLSYRSPDVAIFMIGLNTKKLHLGYSYDLNCSNLRTATSETHEIMLGYRFKQKQGKGIIIDPNY